MTDNLKEFGKLKSNLLKDGFVKIENFLDTEKEKIKKIVKSYNLPKDEKETHFSIDFKSNLIKLLKLDFKKLFDSIYLINFAKQNKINDISDLLFDDNNSLKMIEVIVHQLVIKKFCHGIATRLTAIL